MRRTSTNFNRSVNLFGTVSAENSITITGNGTANTTGTSNEGVLIDGSVTSSAGTVTIAGRAGTGYGYGYGSRNSGVVVGSSGSISSSGTGIDITGCGTTDPNADTDSHGVDIQGTVAGTSASSVAVTGFGGRGTDFNQGVSTGPISSISTENGAITIEGTANAATTGQNNRGISAQGTIASTGTGAVSLTGTGGGGTDFNEGVTTFSGSNISSVNGAITIDGTANTATTGQNNRGISAQGTIESTGTGSVSLTGTGGGGTDFNMGVAAFSGSNISSVDGDITIDGTGSSSSTGQGNSGISLQGTIASTGTGSIDLTGTGGSGTSYNNGVYIGGDITTNGGAITITGNASVNPTTGNSNTGINIDSGTLITQGSGQIHLTGTGSSTTSSPGIYLYGANFSTQSGAIELVGNATNSNNGIKISNYSDINNLNGIVTITGNTTQPTTGVSITGAKLSTQDIDINANTISISDGFGDGTVFASFSSAGGVLSFQALSSSSPLNLNFNSPDAFVSGGFSEINLGRLGDTGSVTLTGNSQFSFSDPVTIWSQNADFTLNAPLIGTDDASIKIEGSGATTTLNANTPFPPENHLDLIR